jgi:hypothetical protein
MMIFTLKVSLQVVNGKKLQKRPFWLAKPCERRSLEASFSGLNPANDAAPLRRPWRREKAIAAIVKKG